MSNADSRYLEIDAIYKDTTRETWELLNALESVLGRPVGARELANKGALLAEACVPRSDDRADAPPKDEPACCKCGRQTPRLVRARGSKADHCHLCAQMVRKMYIPART